MQAAVSELDRSGLMIIGQRREPFPDPRSGQLVQRRGPARAFQPAAEEGHGLAVQAQRVRAAAFGAQVAQERPLQVLQVRRHKG